MQRIIKQNRIIKILGISALLVFLSALICFTLQNKTEVSILASRIINGSAFEKETPFPELTGPTKRNYSWTYQNIDYQISLTLYKSLYDHYQSLSKAYEYFSYENTDEVDQKYYEMYIKTPPEDKTFQKLASLIKEEAVKTGLNHDETADLALAFTQTLAYNNDLALDIKSGLYSGSKYPYEVLYEKGGVCGGKSFLTVILFRELGYGTAIFAFPNEDHITAGIKCPSNYSSYASGFCLAETTGFGHPIGISNRLDPKSNQSITRTKIDPFNPDNTTEESIVLGSAEIYQLSDGLSYQKIKNNLEMEKQIKSLNISLDDLRSQLDKLNNTIKADNAKLKELEENLDKFKADKMFVEYNKLVPVYNELIDKTKKKIKTYNEQVNEYNEIGVEVNDLIDKLYQK